MKRPARYLPALRAGITQLQERARERRDRFALEDAESLLLIVSQLQELARELEREELAR